MKFSKTKAILASLLLAGSLLMTTIIQAETYTVKPGDTLSDIASVLQTTVDELARFNHIENKNLIMIGQVLQTNQAVNTATEQTVNTVVQPEVIIQEENQEITPEVSKATEVPSNSDVGSNTDNNTPDTTVTNASNFSAGEAAAKEEIARRESGGSYTARNGQYYGRYQLTESYLNGDLSPENQERVADAYVASRYGSWSAALAFSNANGWY